MCFSIAGIVLGFEINFCGLQHIVITSDLKNYENSLDPDFCNGLVEKINFFNLDCEPKIEILDCG